MKTLIDILSYRRPHQSHSLRECANVHIVPLGAKPDAFGNLILDIGDKPSILWSAHLDTVHKEQGRQRIIATDKQIMTLPGRKGYFPNCLGADDGVGMWLLMQMVNAGIPGRYVWHMGEERGGLGSSFIAKDGETLKGISIAMAFDRRGTTDVITHQFGGRTASDAFALSFALALHNVGLPSYKPEHGVFTDTANYADILPECSNLSCGYTNEHHNNEAVNVPHVLALRDALCTMDVSGLEIARKPGEDDVYDAEYWHRSYHHGLTASWRDVDYSKWVDIPESGYKTSADGSDMSPRDVTRVWLDDTLTNECHCLRYDHDISGKTLCGQQLDTGDYWCVGDTWEPDYFCPACLDIEAEEYDDYLDIMGIKHRSQY